MSRDLASALHMTPAIYLVIPVIKLGAGLVALFTTGVLVGKRAERRAAL